jgi:hypothetical protein
VFKPPSDANDEELTSGFAAPRLLLASRQLKSTAWASNRSHGSRQAGLWVRITPDSCQWTSGCATPSGHDPATICRATCSVRRDRLPAVEQHSYHI